MENSPESTTVNSNISRKSGIQDIARMSGFKVPVKGLLTALAAKKPPEKIIVHILNHGDKDSPQKCQLLTHPQKSLFLFHPSLSPVVEILL